MKWSGCLDIYVTHSPGAINCAQLTEDIALVPFDYVLSNEHCFANLAIHYFAIPPTHVDDNLVVSFRIWWKLV